MTTACREPVVQLSALSKSFGAVPAVSGLTLSVRAGETVALLGPNGAGKSTVISMLLGLLRPDAGSVTLFGRRPALAVRDGRVGAGLQDCRLPWYATVAELVALARAAYPQPLPTAEILKTAGLDRLARRRLERLSGGETQRVKFGFAIAGNPDLLVLDEPTAGMDVAARQGFWLAIRRHADLGKTVLFATHYLADADEFADRVVMLAKGRVVADGPSAELRRMVGWGRVSFQLGTCVAEGLDRLPGVRSVEVRGDRVRLTSDDTDATAAALISRCGPVRGLDVTSAGLAEAFLALTRSEETSDGGIPGL